MQRMKQIKVNLQQRRRTKLHSTKTSTEPSLFNDIFDFEILYDKMALYKTYDKVWTITSAINKNMPTWNAYNSLISKEKEPTVIQV